MTTTPFLHVTTAFWATSENYIGTKQIQAIPMTRGEYADIRGWNVPKNESRDDGGYIVRYEDGHVSWSPENTFDSCYVSNGRLDFGQALHCLKDGNHMARMGWNGASQYIYLVHAQDPFQAFIAIHTVQETQVPWLASQTDMLANDWVILD